MPLAFAPGAALPLSRPRARSARQVPRAAVKDDAGRALDAEAGEGPDVAFSNLAPPTRRVAIAAAAAVAAAFGFVGTPQKVGELAKPMAGGVLAVSTGVGVGRLASGRKKSAKKALAKAMEISSEVDGPEVISCVGGLESRFGLTKDENMECVRAVYEFYLLETIRDGRARYSEMADLARLKKALSMTGPMIGDAHFEVARAFYRNNVVYLDALDDDAGRDAAQSKLSKLFFLSDRMFADKETDEAYAYEVSRICDFFGFPTSDFDTRVQDVALPFYKALIARACNDANIDGTDISIAQEALGVSDTAASTVRRDAYADTVAAIVTNKGKIDSNDTSLLGRLRGLLDIADDQADGTLKSLAEPVYRVEVSKALDAASEKTDSMASIYGRLALRQSELGLTSDVARKALCGQASARAVEIVKRASKYLRVQNIASCTSVVKELLTYCDDILDLVAVSSGDSGEGQDPVNVISSFLVGIPDALSRTEPRSMYRLFLSDILNNRVVSEKEEAQLRKLRTVLGLSEMDALSAFKAAAGPVYRKAVVEALSGDKFDEATKANKDKIKADLALPIETSKSIDLDLYRDRLASIVTGNRIMQEQEAQALFMVRDFLGLSDTDVASAHKGCCGPVYEQSVSEAMGATGIMLDEYREGLGRLRSRLLLSEDDASQAFYKVVKARMRMYVDRAMEQLEKRQNYRGGAEERDVGDDPNIRRAGATLGIDAGGLPIELSNLVDFYVRNKLVVEEQVPAESVATEGSGTATATATGDGSEAEGEKKPEMRTVQKYPVSLRGDIQPKVYNELYKQYVIQCFSAQTRSEKQRLFASLDQLGPILGMTDDEVTAVHSSIGTVIYKNYLDQTLLKGPVGDSDMDFLNNIQKMLTMKEETCAKLLKDGKENRVSVLLERIFSQPKVLAEQVRNMRAIAVSLGVDIVTDLKISREQRKRLFGVEVDEAIDTGAVTGDNQELINSVQSGLQVPPEDAKEVLLACIQRRTLSHLVQAAGSLRQDRSETVVAELRTMLRYGKLLPAKVDAPAVSSMEKQEMFLLFQADAITDGAINDKSAESLNLLQTLLGFTDADLEATVS